MQPTYFRPIVSKVTYVECWRASRTWLEFILVAIVKTLRIPLPRAFGVAGEGFRRVEWEQLSGEARDALGPARDELEPAGFHYCFCYTYPTVGPYQLFKMVSLADDAAAFAIVEYEKQQASEVANESRIHALVTQFTTGRVIITCDRREIYPPDFEVEGHPRKSVMQLIQRHRLRVEEAVPARARLWGGTDDLARRVEDLDQCIFHGLVERGVLVPLGDEDVECLRAGGPAVAPPPAEPLPATQRLAASAGETTNPYASQPIDAGAAMPGAGVGAETAPVFEAQLAEAPGSRYPAILAEIDKLQNKRAGWLGGAVILGLSILLFVGLGAAQWQWKFVLLLIPILLFHECGHLVAMRVFEYRNLRMFFIPLFGAAVTGQNYNVAGWKKAVVSLAGPVPGIAVGCVLGVAALLTEQSLLLEAAALTIFLNAFNLLPFLPLDGGWVMHAVFFSRHHWLDVGFRLLAALALISTFLLGLRLLALLGVLMLLGLRSASRIARIAAQLRQGGVATSSPDGLSIPPQTADVIVDHIDAAFGTPLPNNLKAQYVLQVFQSINARPPGLLASLALAAAHAMSFAVGFVFFVILAVARHAQ